jgi:hypothetical protein
MEAIQMAARTKLDPLPLLDRQGATPGDGEFRT